MAEPTDYYDKQALEQADDERLFDLAYTELLGRVAEAVTQAAQLLHEENGESRPWTRDEAVLVGLAVRCSKLLRAYAQHFEQRQMEICNYLGRGLLETSIDLGFLLHAGTTELFQKFVAYSFVSDLRLKAEIESNIDEQSGIVLPIEDRMLEGIQRRLKQARVTLEEIPDSPRASWGGSMRDKLEKLGMQEMYQGAFAGPSSAFTHGGWHELVIYHLREADKEGRYYAKTAFTDVRPQPANLLCVITTEAVMHFLWKQLPETDQRDDLLDQLSAMHDAAADMGQMHENYIGRTGGPDFG
jgi:hypothetical protein